eukprot:scaffold3226_cov251-Pinguiococcus_pyrenoidosus.AAC.3
MPLPAWLHTPKPPRRRSVARTPNDAPTCRSLRAARKCEAGEGRCARLRAPPSPPLEGSAAPRLPGR